MIQVQRGIRGFALVGASIFGLATSANADGPFRGSLKDYGPAPFSWTGFYAGLNAGYAWGNSDTSIDPGSKWRTSGLPGDIVNSDFFIANGGTNLKPSSFLGGLQAGYNWQMNSVVVGFESDINWQNLDESSDRGPFPVAGGNSQRYLQSVQSNWLATFRGRLGYAFDRTLVYATGGLAVAEHEYDASLIFNAGNPNYSGSISKTDTGWTVGGGLEHALTPNWTIKAEYLFVDFGKDSVVSNEAVPGYTVTHTNRLEENIVRAGLNYKF